MLSKTPLTQHKAQAANCRCKTELYNFPFLWLAVGLYYYFFKIFKEVKKPPAVLWCKEQGRCTHPLHPDLCRTGSTDAPRCPISLCSLTICLLETSQCNTIVFLGESPFSITFLSSATLAELLPLDLPPPPPQEKLLHIPTWATKGSFTPGASQEQHVCQEIWCQYLPGALQSQLHNPGQASLHPFSPAIYMCQCGENIAAKIWNEPGFQPSFLLVEKSYSITWALHLLNPQHPTQSSLYIKYTFWGRKRQGIEINAFPHSHKAWVPM